MSAGIPILQHILLFSKKSDMKFWADQFCLLLIEGNKVIKIVKKRLNRGLFQDSILVLVSQIKLIAELHAFIAIP